MSGVFVQVDAAAAGGALNRAADGLRRLRDGLARAFGFRRRVIECNIDDRSLLDLIGQLRRRGDLRPALEDIGQVLVTSADLAFRNESDPWGRPWQPLSPVTLLRRRGTTAQILRDTGRLANSVNAQVTGSRVKAGTDVIYAATHQFGRRDNRMYNTPRGRPAPIPPRPFFPVRPGGRPDIDGAGLREEIAEILREHVGGVS